VLLKPELAHMVVDRIVDAAVFTDKTLRHVFEACRAVYQDGREISQASVRRQLELNDVDAGFFNTLLIEIDTDVSPVSAPIADGYVDLLLDLFNTKRLKEGAARVRRWDDGVKLARQALDWDAGIERDPPTPAQMWADAIKLQEQINAGEKRVGLSWGLPSLDARASLTPGLWLAAAPKKSAKSHFLVHVADHGLTLEEPVPAAVFSLEMRRNAFVRRLLARHTGVNSARIHRNVKLSDVEMAKLQEDYAYINTNHYPLELEHCPGITINNLVSRIRRWAYKNEIRDGHGVVIVDFLQQITQDHRAESEAYHLKRCAYALADVASELEIPCVAAVQFNLTAEKAVEKAREKKSYSVWDCPYGIQMIEGSGGPAQAAEGVLITDLLRRRDPNHRKQESDDRADILIVLAEQRHGAGGGAVRCHVDLRTSRFTQPDQCRRDSLPI
jgi:replicative DNA helicase